MKPKVLNLTNGLYHSFSTRIDTLPNVNSHWHCHNELELIFIKRGSGTQYVGDSIRQFKSGDVVLVGRNLPHYWHYSKQYLNDSCSHTVESYAVHFNEDFWGEGLLKLPEFTEIRKVLERAKQGLQILGKQQLIVGELIAQLVVATGAKRIALLIACLSEISVCREARPLATIGFQSDLPEVNLYRLQSIYNYTIRNHNSKIDIRKIADFANLSPNSFCRLFKKASGKTYMEFLNEVRVGQACKLLIEDSLSVKEICYQCGFVNFSSFHKTFKKLTGATPLVYQKVFEQAQQ